MEEYLCWQGQLARTVEASLCLPHHLLRRSLGSGHFHAAYRHSIR